MKDSFLHKGLRKKLVDEISNKGITNNKILNAIMQIPRHLFMDNAFVNFAYQDKAFPIGSGQTISQPYTVAFQTQLLDIKPYQKVLEIGTGSGYQAAILAQLVEKVYSVERIKSLQEKARERLANLGIKNVRLVHSDGRTGLAEFAPYNAILSAAAPHEIPGDLLKQLAPNGILIIPVGTIDDQELRVITRDGESLNFREKVAQKVRFVPLVKGLSNQ